MYMSPFSCISLVRRTYGYVSKNTGFYNKQNPRKIGGKSFEMTMEWGRGVIFQWKIESMIRERISFSRSRRERYPRDRKSSQELRSQRWLLPVHEYWMVRFVEFWKTHSYRHRWILQALSFLTKGNNIVNNIYKIYLQNISYMIWL